MNKVLTFTNNSDIFILSKGNRRKPERRNMQGMTDKQMQFIAWLITTATDKCQTVEEVREMNKEIRKHSAGLKEEDNGSTETEK